jgi:hypothetical protein
VGNTNTNCGSGGNSCSSCNGQTPNCVNQTCSM